MFVCGFTVWGEKQENKNSKYIFSGLQQLVFRCLKTFNEKKKAGKYNAADDLLKKVLHRDRSCALVFFFFFLFIHLFLFS